MKSETKDKLIFVFGTVYLVVCLLRMNDGEGVYWTRDRFGMRRTLVAADGWHYPTGEEIDPFTRLLANSGLEGLLMLLSAGCLGGLISVGFGTLRRGLRGAWLAGRSHKGGAVWIEGSLDDRKTKGA
jgi:hypothetical protein